MLAAEITFIDELLPRMVIWVVRSDNDSSSSLTPVFSSPRIIQINCLFLIFSLNISESKAMLESVISSEMIYASDSFSAVTSSTALSCWVKATCFSVQRDVLFILVFGGTGVVPQRCNFSIPRASHNRNRPPTFCGLFKLLAIICKGYFDDEALWSLCLSCVLLLTIEFVAQVNSQLSRFFTGWWFSSCFKPFAHRIMIQKKVNTSMR